jgi:hypothetical protein
MSPEGVTLGLIVEGHGEEQAVPALIRNVARALDITLRSNALLDVSLSRF